jgi:hypothetical protein
MTSIYLFGLIWFLFGFLFILIPFVYIERRITIDNLSMCIVFGFAGPIVSLIFTLMYFNRTRKMFETVIWQRRNK